MDFETIIYDQNGGMLTITLNRPDKLNAFTDTMLNELGRAFDQAALDKSVRAIILTGAGRGFCPGQDLSEVEERAQAVGNPGYGEHLRQTYNPLVTKMRRLPKPIVGAINGPAAGAGMSVALACDLRIAAESASFLQAFIKIGLVPDSGSTWMLPRLIGLTKAMELMLTGRKVSAQEALELGIVNQVVPDDELMPVVTQTAQQLAAAPTKAIGYIKRAVDFAMNGSFEAALDYEAIIQEVAGRSSDHAEGLSAFLQKRPPKFTGE